MGAGILGTLTARADRAARWSAIALGFSIPISIALDSVLVAGVVAGWLLSGDFRHKRDAVARNPFAISALLLFAMLLIGTLYGQRDPGDTSNYLVKYVDLLLIPVFAYCFRDAADRQRAIFALAASLALTLALSLVVKTGWLPHVSFIKGDSANASVFKHYNSHSVLMSFAAFLFVNLSVRSTSADWRRVWLGLAILAAVNVLLMVQGRTGYVVLGALTLYAGFCWKGWRGLGVTFVAACLLGGVLAVTPNPARERVLLVMDEARAWQPGKPSETSTGFRLSFYHNGLAIMGKHPALGVGTGGYPRAYSEQTRGTGITPSRNPHSEYLLIGVQTGLFGLALLLHLFWQHWRLAPRLATPFETRLARGLVLTFAVGCLFNSLLLDHTEGLLFAWMSGLLFGGLQSVKKEIKT